MLKVDTDNITMNVKKLDKCIKDYVENNDNFFYEMSKIDSLWNDENKDLLDDKIKNDRNNSLLIINNLEKMCSLYIKINDLYKKL